jgi:predicted homoserine dehydrogenase-like protein
MLSRIGLAVVVAVAVTLGCLLLGVIFVSLGVEVAVTVGNFLKSYAAAIGVLAGLYRFFVGGRV